MRLPFTLDPQIIHHVIYNQAGSIGKAIIELIMNSIDAGGTGVRITVSEKGFVCTDDGRGFASREDVLNYFGRFGTPHQEGDATYGRFRLGRGQIMAHARTSWTSNAWTMAVDTKVMGYHYDLEDVDEPKPGCSITGEWYEPLSSIELLSAVQEIRDLVRYTPVSVEMNGRVISRDPRTEKWDFEDEFAYYRAKPEGAVSIYNQGVLVRHDASHLWGAGGLIVSKKAIDLNVSRTEILRKTCIVWKPIAKQFAKMAEEVAARLGDHRKTEARREKSAHALLSGDANAFEIFDKEEVITLLPGKRHLTLRSFLDKVRQGGPSNCRARDTYTVVLNGFDVPKGEAIATADIVMVVHPQTLERFGCYGVQEFEESLRRVIEHVETVAPDWWRRHYYRYREALPKAVDFETIRDAFVQRMSIVSEKTLTDRETRRAWTAMRWCLQNYAGLAAGGQAYTDGRLAWNDSRRMQVLLGESNTAEAWTDGESYIAFNKRIVERLRVEPLRTANRLFSLAEHEVAHQGDSVDCGHDEAFYQRYHDISINMSEMRARYLHIFLSKLHRSMESEGKPKDNYKAYYEMQLANRVGDGRQKRGLPPAIEDVRADPVVTTEVPAENMAFIDLVNSRLVQAGVCSPPPDLIELIERARKQQEILNAERVELLLQDRSMREAQNRENEAAGAEFDAWFENERSRIAEALGVPIEQVWSEVVFALEGLKGEALQDAWAQKPWGDDCGSLSGGFGYQRKDQEERVRIATELRVSTKDLDADALEHLHGKQGEELKQAWADWKGKWDGHWAAMAADAAAVTLNRDAEEMAKIKRDVGEGLSATIDPHETKWSLERNAAAAGFFGIADYLAWRKDGVS
ncbi:MAG: ATP-binding protein [Roseateles sp.]|nr:MAG: ATP-binding protein [Roseateles sp.]